MLDLRHTFRTTTQRAYSAKEYIEKAYPYWIGALIVSAVSYFYSLLLQLGNKMFLMVHSQYQLWSLVWMMGCFIVAALIPYLYSAATTGSGIPQLYAALELSEHKDQKQMNQLLGWRVIPAKIVSSFFVILGGGVAGREGPTLQISGSIFYQVYKWASQRSTRKIEPFLMAGAASGLAAAFNTPLGGIVFVIEELAKSKINEFRSSVLQAVIISGLFTQIFVGSYLLYGYPKVKNFHPSMIIAIMGVSVVAGLLMIVVVGALKRIVLFRKTVNSPLRAVLFAIASSLILWTLMIALTPQSATSGHLLIEGILFENQVTTWVDVAGKSFGMVTTYLSGAAGGIFAPTLSIGAAIGSAINASVELNLPLLLPLCGMVAALAALTQSPLTSFILILEMTDRHSSILALMISALVGYAIPKIFQQISFYDFVSHQWIEKLRGQEEQRES